jgi:membrane protease YdiL (CAAX protease family)
MIYLIGVGVFLGLDERVPRELGSDQYRSVHSIYDVFIGFSITVLICFIFFISLYVMGVFFQGVSAPENKYILPTFIYQLVIVVASEEIIFRGIIFRYFRDLLYTGRHERLPVMAIFIQGLIFSVFHVTAYSFDFGSLVFALLMGWFLGYCVYRWNIGVALAVHFMWNAMALGLFFFLM